jgi:hypothetical protein
MRAHYKAALASSVLALLAACDAGGHSAASNPPVTSPPATSSASPSTPPARSPTATLSSAAQAVCVQLQAASTELSNAAEELTSNAGHPTGQYLLDQAKASTDLNKAISAAIELPPTPGCAPRSGDPRPAEADR